MNADREAVSDDAVLGGRLMLRQPKRGHRVGHDAVLLAAAVHPRRGELIVDLGAGVGAAGLAVAQRCDGASVALLEIAPALVALAEHNIAANGLAGRVRAICLDCAASAAAFTAAGLPAGSAAQVMMNPPFNPPRHQASADGGRRLAHNASPRTLEVWLRAAVRLLKPAGTLTAIWRADGLDALLAGLAGRFGGVTVLPIHSRPDAAAIRVVIGAVKGSRAPLRILPGLCLNDSAGKPSAASDAVLRGADTLELGLKPQRSAARSN
jgi:tRNA1(Val) A37 N6-methylase TrmN6